MNYSLDKTQDEFVGWSRQDVVVRLRRVSTDMHLRLRHVSGVDSLLTPSRAAVLAAVVEHGPIRMADLASRVYVGRSAISRIVTPLVEMNLVELSDDPHDGRAVLVTATSVGRDVHDDVIDRTDAFLAERLESLSLPERAILAGALTVLEGVVRAD